VTITPVNDMISGIGVTPIEAGLALGALALVLSRWLTQRLKREVTIRAAAV